MRNYTIQNLVAIPASQVSSGALAVKIGDNVFLAGGIQYVSDSIEVFLGSQYPQNIFIDIRGTHIESDSAWYAFSAGQLITQPVSDSFLVDFQIHMTESASANNPKIPAFLHLSENAVTNGAHVYTHGQLYISSGGTAINTLLDSKGSLTVLSGGTASSVQVLNGGYMNVQSGAYIKDVSIDCGSYTRFIAEAVCDAPRMPIGQVTMKGSDSAAYTYVASGQTGSNMIISSGTTLVIQDGYVSNVSVLKNGLIYNFGSAQAMHVFSGGSVINFANISDIHLQALGEAYNFSIISSAHVLDYRGCLYNEGAVYYLTIANEGICNCDSSSYIASAIVGQGGHLDLKGSSHVDMLGGFSDRAFIEVWDNTVTIDNVDGIGNFQFKGNVVSATFQPGANISALGVTFGNTLQISSGVFLQATDIVADIIQNGGVIAGNIAEVVSGQLSGVTISKSSETQTMPTWLPDSAATIHSGTTASSVTVVSGGSLLLFDGAEVNDVTISQGGYLVLYGMPKIDSDSWQTADPSFIVSNFAPVGIQVKSGSFIRTMDQLNNQNNSKTSYGYITLSSGISLYFNTTNTMISSFTGSALDYITLAWGAGLQISSGGSSKQVRNFGDIRVSSGGLIQNIRTVGAVSVYNGGVVNSATVGPGGHLIISTGGFTSKVVLRQEAVVTDPYMGQIVVQGGWLRVDSGASAVDVSVGSGAYLIYYSGTVTGITSSQGAIVQEIGDY